MQVVITIPAYNEEAHLGNVLDEIKSIMSKTEYKYKILVVDDGSKDKTSEVAKEHGAIVHKNKVNFGLADTFKVEMQKCLELKADIIVHTDADGQYDPVHIPEMIKKIEEGYDIVLGSRFVYKNSNIGFTKKLGNIAFAKVFTNLTKLKITDTTTGYRAFTSYVAKNISFINTFTYTQEQILRAARMKLRITEIPVHTRTTRESRLFTNPLQYAIKAWINILRIYRDFEPLKFFGKMGLICLVLGLILGAWTTYDFVQTGKVGHLPSTILSVLLITTGIQLITFGFLADMKK